MPRPPRLTLWWRPLAVLALATQLVWHVWDVAPPGLLDRSGRLKAPDFLQFYTFGRLVTSDRSSLYDAAAHAATAREIHPRLTLENFTPNYSPFVALLMAPLAWVPFGQAMAVFSILSVALYALAVRLLLAVTATLGRVPRDIVLLCAAWPALFMTLRYGQISALTLALFATAASCHLRGAPLAAGAALGLAVYKPNLLVTPVLTLLLAREWRLLAGVALGAGLGLAVGAGVVGLQGMAAYSGILIDLAGNPTIVQMFGTEQHSLRGLLQMWGLHGVALRLATWLAIPLGALASAYVWHRTRDQRLRWAALVVAALLASPHLLTYDLLVLAVPLLLLGDWLIELPRVARRPWIWALALMYAGAWPGTFLARVYGVQISTIGMLLALSLIVLAAGLPMGRQACERTLDDQFEA